MTTATATPALICNKEYKTAPSKRHPQGQWKKCTKELDPRTNSHAGAHSAAQRKDYAPVTMDDLGTFSIVKEDKERATLAPKTAGAKPEERSDTLKELDRVNAELYKGWVEEGKPKEFEKTGAIGKVRVNPDKVESMRFLIRKSVQFIGHGVQFGKDGVKEVRTGRIVISWRVTDKRERHNNGGTN